MVRRSLDKPYRAINQVDDSRKNEKLEVPWRLRARIFLIVCGPFIWRCAAELVVTQGASMYTLSVDVNGIFGYQSVAVFAPFDKF